MMACSSSHVSGCPMQHPTPLGRFQPVPKTPSAVQKVCVSVNGQCSVEALGVSVQAGHQGGSWSWAKPSTCWISGLKELHYLALRPFVYILLQGRSRRAAALCVQATVAERLEVSASPYIQEPGRGLGFYTGTDGYLYVDNLRIDDIRAQV